MLNTQTHSALTHIANSKGGLFSVPADSELHFDIGRQLTHKEPAYIADCAVATVVDVQKNYKGQLVYRVSRVAGDFGSPLAPAEAKWLTADDTIYQVTYQDAKGAVIVCDGIKINTLATLRVPAVNLPRLRRLLTRGGNVVLSCEVAQ